MEFYSADIEMFMSGWNSLQLTCSEHLLRERNLNSLNGQATPRDTEQFRITVRACNLPMKSCDLIVKGLSSIKKRVKIIAVRFVLIPIWKGKKGFGMTMKGW
jgi:hypothetical protein